MVFPGLSCCFFPARMEIHYALLNRKSEHFHAWLLAFKDTVNELIKSKLLMCWLNETHWLNELSLCYDNERNVISGAGVVKKTVKKSFFFLKVQTSGPFLSIVINMVDSHVKYFEKALVCYKSAVLKMCPDATRF